MLASNLSPERAAYMARGQKYLSSPLAGYVKSCFLGSELPIILFGIGDGKETMGFASMHAQMEGRSVTAYPIDAMDELVRRYADKLTEEHNKFIFADTIGEVEPFLFGLSEEYDRLEWEEESRIKVVTTEPQKVKVREKKLWTPADGQDADGSSSTPNGSAYQWKVLYCAPKLPSEATPPNGSVQTSTLAK